MGKHSPNDLIQGACFKLSGSGSEWFYWELTSLRYTLKHPTLIMCIMIYNNVEYQPVINEAIMPMFYQAMPSCILSHLEPVASLTTTDYLTSLPMIIIKWSMYNNNSRLRNHTSHCMRNQVQVQHRNKKSSLMTMWSSAKSQISMHKLSSAGCSEA